MKEKEMLFGQLKFIKDYWVKSSIESLDENADLIWTDFEKEYKELAALLKENEHKKMYEEVLNEIIKGVMHSILVMVDGGDDLADKFEIDLIVEKSKKSFKKNGALHEDFFEYLLDKEGN